MMSNAFLRHQAMAIPIVVLISITLPALAMPNTTPIETNQTIAKTMSEVFIRPEEVQAIVHQAAEAWMTGNADGFAALFTADGEFIVPGQKWVGQSAIRQATADFARDYSQVKIEIRQIITEGNRAMVEWQWEDVQKASSRRSKADDAIAIDFIDGKISRWREYIDAETPKHK